MIKFVVSIAQSIAEHLIQEVALEIMQFADVMLQQSLSKIFLNFLIYLCNS